MYMSHMYPYDITLVYASCVCCESTCLTVLLFWGVIAKNNQIDFFKKNTFLIRLNNQNEGFSGKIPFSELGPGMAEARRISIAFCYQSIYGSAPQERWRRDSIVHEIMCRLNIPQNNRGCVEQVMRDVLVAEATENNQIDALWRILSLFLEFLIWL